MSTAAVRETVAPPLTGATGVGSLPGTDPAEASRIVLGELPDLPHLPELPARGPGADLIGRTAAMLVGLHVDLQPAGWRLVDAAGRDERRGASYLAYDLDAFEEAAQGHVGWVKVQLAGPWTLAASIELPRGNRSLSDGGAVRDLGQSLAETVRVHVADLRRRLPRARLVVQLDEPSLPGVLRGSIPTASGFGHLPEVLEHEAEAQLAQVLAAVVEAGALPAVHCCAPDVPVRLLTRAGARALSVDLTLTGHDEDAFGEAVESGVSLLAGTVASTGPDDAGRGGTKPSEAAATVRALWHRLGLPVTGMEPGVMEAVVVTPTCGLAGASPDQVRAALTACREASRRLAEDPEGERQ